MYRCLMEESQSLKQIENVGYLFFAKKINSIKGEKMYSKDYQLVMIFNTCKISPPFSSFQDTKAPFLPLFF